MLKLVFQMSKSLTCLCFTCEEYMPSAFTVVKNTKMKGCYQPDVDHNILEITKTLLKMNSMISLNRTLHSLIQLMVR